MFDRPISRIFHSLLAYANLALSGNWHPEDPHRRIRSMSLSLNRSRTAAMEPIRLDSRRAILRNSLALRMNHCYAINGNVLQFLERSDGAHVVGNVNVAVSARNVVAYAKFIADSLAKVHVAIPGETTDIGIGCLVELGEYPWNDGNAKSVPHNVGLGQVFQRQALVKTLTVLEPVADVVAYCSLRKVAVSILIEDAPCHFENWILLPAFCSLCLGNRISFALFHQHHQAYPSSTTTTDIPRMRIAKMSANHQDGPSLSLNNAWRAKVEEIDEALLKLSTNTDHAAYIHAAHGAGKSTSLLVHAAGVIKTANPHARIIYILNSTIECSVSTQYIRENPSDVLNPFEDVELDPTCYAPKFLAVFTYGKFLEKLIQGNALDDRPIVFVADIPLRRTSEAEAFFSVLLEQMKRRAFTSYLFLSAYRS
ncbi:hypothetical protein PFICI_14833 [Pestalotiopsis fici W106-1]|uniref:Uncharacterized protein n=1 Tax=Pestalotiopsis fici (strain W106-1 / CGMCC3.15140) TaxID=1229662 RepID=W3WH78_PESFW|nr:uncharacterized protein PFICI_14833 [Pestalotiopsis fici W106-1]ETS73228.1 hypothetical protein PFICI_14833 [Pestalotiopsis fici W106-1]